MADRIRTSCNAHSDEQAHRGLDLWGYRVVADRVAEHGGTVPMPDGRGDVCTLQALAALRDDLCLLCQADERLDYGPDGTLVCPEPTGQQLDARMQAPALLAEVDRVLDEVSADDEPDVDDLDDLDVPDDLDAVEREVMVEQAAAERRTGGRARPSRSPGGRARPVGGRPRRLAAAAAAEPADVGVRRLDELDGAGRRAAAPTPLPTAAAVEPPAARGRERTSNGAAATHVDPGQGAEPGPTVHARSTTSDGQSTRRDGGRRATLDRIEVLAADRRRTQRESFERYRSARNGTQGSTSVGRATRSTVSTTDHPDPPANGPQRRSERVSAGRADRPGAARSREPEPARSTRAPHTGTAGAEPTAERDPHELSWRDEVAEQIDAYDPEPLPDGVDELVALAFRETGSAIVRAVQRARAPRLPRALRRRERPPQRRELPATTGDPVSAAHEQFLRDIGAVRDEVN